MTIFEKPLSDLIVRRAAEIEIQIAELRKNIECVAECNQLKVLKAMQKCKVSDFHFSGSTGYGYNDHGREVIDQVYAEVFGCEAALVRPHIVSGTHAISTALFGILRPGDEMLIITGTPYDTLQKVIGKSSNGDDQGTLADWGVSASIVDLDEHGEPRYEEIRRRICGRTKLIAIQRSRGYDWRTSFSVEKIAEMTAFVKSIRADLIVFIDNCYGEFTEKTEPTDIGVDLMAGSLIKNPGGGIATTGGYIVGKKVYIDRCAYRLTAPGIGAEVGATLNTNRLTLHGLFMAPHIVGQAIQGAIFAAAIFASFHLETNPRWDEARTDLIQAVRFADAESLLRFVRAIQHCSPVDAHVTPEPWDMPGYEHQVVMAAGTFIQGASLELTADAPIREPYIAYMQGGLTYPHVKLSVLYALSEIFRHGIDN
jgi:cystathionine beta-lyase family protein involved in aluminum resistance